jgi:lambda family phage portal protein
MDFFHGVFKKKASVPYDGAGHGKRLGNWHPSSSSINALLASSLSTLRSRSHDLVRKNPYAANAVDSIVSNCIGTGIKPQSKAKDSEFRKKIQELWLNWTDEADAAGLCDFYGLQSLVLRSIIESGECFVRLKINKSNDAVPLKLQVLESEHLDSSKDGLLPNGNVVKSGIEFDKTGKRVAYYIFGTAGWSWRFYRMPWISQMIQLFLWLNGFRRDSPGLIRRKK